VADHIGTKFRGGIVTGQRDLRFSFNIVGGMAFELVEFTLEEGPGSPPPRPKRFSLKGRWQNRDR